MGRSQRRRIADRRTSGTLRRVVIGSPVVTVIAIAAAAIFALTGPVGATPTAAPMWVAASTTLSGHDIAVSGGIQNQADLGGAKVSIYRREVGENSDTLVGEVPVTCNMMTGNVFEATIPAVVRSCIITAVWVGDAGHGPSSTWMFAGVQPKLKVRALVATPRSTKLRIEVSPAQPSFSQGLTRPDFIAEVQCRRGGRWIDFPGELGTA
jgi:hypothetical protein